MIKLSTKQALVLEFVEWHINENGYAPTYQEIGNMIGIQPNSVHRMMMILEEKGYVKTEMSKARAIKVLKGVQNDFSN